MRHQVSRSPEALRDLEQLIDYISHDSPDAARRFLHASRDTFDFLLLNREVGHECRFAPRETLGLRVWPVQGFRNHLVFYRPIDKGIEIVRVLHGARDIESLFGDE